MGEVWACLVTALCLDCPTRERVVRSAWAALALAVLAAVANLIALALAVHGASASATGTRNTTMEKGCPPPLLLGLFLRTVAWLRRSSTQAEDG